MAGTPTAAEARRAARRAPAQRNQAEEQEQGLEQAQEERDGDEQQGQVRQQEQLWRRRDGEEPDEEVRSVASDDSESEEEEGGYDSDDAEKWGPYYWSASSSSSAKPQAAPMARKAVDHLKYASFRTLRKLHFAGEVLTHFFGLHQSEYQWMLDAVQREERIEQQEKDITEQRRMLALQKQAEAAASASSV